MRALIQLVMLAALALPLAGWAQQEADQAEPEEPGEPVEFLSLAAVLIGDGNYQRARNILARVDTAAEDVDLARYHTLAGLVALNLDELPLAATEFEDAIAAGQSDPVIRLYLAQAYFGQTRYAETLEQLGLAGDDATRVPSVFLMR